MAFVIMALTPAHCCNGNRPGSCPATRVASFGAIAPCSPRRQLTITVAGVHIARDRLLHISAGVASILPPYLYSSHTLFHATPAVSGACAVSTPRRHHAIDGARLIVAWLNLREWRASCSFAALRGDDCTLEGLHAAAASGAAVALLPLVGNLTVLEEGVVAALIFFGEFTADLLQRAKLTLQIPELCAAAGAHLEHRCLQLAVLPRLHLTLL
mmetsp:Transcript_17099/g.46348  ORF Transcript_17099/g.46348 Transcript_17099/m.46348 type:complete len:213 (-) Transcript_17099:1310-1948(-)